MNNSSINLKREKSSSPGNGDMLSLAKTIANKNKEVSIMLGGYG